MADTLSHLAYGLHFWFKKKVISCSYVVATTGKSVKCVRVLCECENRAIKYVSFWVWGKQERKKLLYCIRFSTITALIGERWYCWAVQCKKQHRFHWMTYIKPNHIRASKRDTQSNGTYTQRESESSRMGKKCGMKNSLSLRLCECGACVLESWSVHVLKTVRSRSRTLSCRVLFFPPKAHEQHTSLLHVHLYTQHTYDERGHMDEHKLYVKLASRAMYKRKCCKRKWKKKY